MSNTVQVDNSRLVTVENDVKHLANDVGEIKTELTEFRAIHTDVAKSLARLTVIAEQNQKADSKIELILGRIQRLENWQFKAAGIMAAALFIASMFGSEIKAAIGF